MGLVGLYCYLTKPVKEGIRNMNCCGGIEAGVHYSETDTKPPVYVRRCFESNSDGSYNWSGFPCTGKGECCKDTSGGKPGECIPTTKGGYCKGDSNFMFNPRSSKVRPYMKFPNDEVLDINDTTDMKDYFYDRGEKDRGKSVEMQRFLARRSRNEKYMEEHLRDKHKSEQSKLASTNEKLREQNKKIELVTTITIIHLLFLLIFSIVIRAEVIQRIDGFYNLVYIQYLSFMGKPKVTP